MNVVELSTAPDYVHPMGSEVKDFVELGAELAQAHADPDVTRTLDEMLIRQTRKDVGGSLQVGVSGKGGFRVLPALSSGSSPDEKAVRFLG